MIPNNDDRTDRFNVHPDEWPQIEEPTALDFIPKPPDFSARTWFEIKRWALTDEPGVTKKLFLGRSKDIVHNKKEDTNDSQSET